MLQVINASMRRLSVFKAVYETGGVNAAADQLDIAQPSVTAHIKALEAELGTLLFVRHRGRKLRATDSGEMLYQYARNLLSTARETRSMLEKLQQNQTLGVGVQRSIADHIMPDVLSRFLQAHPDTAISIHSETQEGLATLLRDGRVDIGLMFHPTEVPGYVVKIIGEEELAIIASARHPLARRKEISLDEVGRHGFVGPIRRSQFFKLIDDEMCRIGLVNRNIVLCMQDTASVKQAVVHGMGLACTLRSSCRDEIGNGSVVTLDVAAPRMALQVQCIFRAEALPPAGRDFMDFLDRNSVWSRPEKVSH